MLKMIVVILASLLSLGYATDKQSAVKSPMQFSRQFEKKWKDWNTEQDGRCLVTVSVYGGDTRSCQEYPWREKGWLDLDFSNDNFNDDDVVDLVHEMSAGHFKRLTSLHLENNNIGDRGAEALAHMIDQDFNPFLELIYLHGNKIGPKGKAALRLALEHSKLIGRYISKYGDASGRIHPDPDNIEHPYPAVFVDSEKEELLAL